MNPQRYQESERITALGIIAVKAKDDPQALSALLKALDDPSPKVRSNAVGLLGTEKFIEGYLTKGLDNPDEEVRISASSALESLRELGTPEEK